MTLEPGTIAPAFTIIGIDGERYVYPHDAAGQPLLLVFFKTTCETCDIAFPYLNRLRETYPRGWSFWAIAQDPAEAAAAYASRHAMTYPVLVDAPTYEVSRTYDPPATPTLFLVAGDGRIAYTTHGFAKDDINHLARLVAAYVGGDPVTIAPEDDGRAAFRPG